MYIAKKCERKLQTYDHPNIMPIVGIVTASITLNEIITMEECLGAVVILLGVYITTHTKQILEKLNWKK